MNQSLKIETVYYNWKPEKLMNDFFYPKSKFHVVRTNVECIAVDVDECQEEILICMNRIEDNDWSNFDHSYED